MPAEPQRAQSRSPGLVTRFGRVSLARRRIIWVLLASACAGALGARSVGPGTARVAASGGTTSVPSNLRLTGLDSTLVAQWQPASDPSIMRQVVTASTSDDRLVETKVVPAQQASVDLNGLETGAPFKVTVQATNASGNLSSPITAAGRTVAQAPMANAAFFDNFNAMPTANLPSGYQMGDLDPNYYDVRSSDDSGDLSQFTWARQTFQHERHYHSLVIGSQGQAGLMIRPRVPVDLSAGRTATLEFEVDLAPGQHAHGKWFEVYLVDSNNLPSDHEQLTTGGTPAQWPNSLEFDAFQSAQDAGIQGNNLPQISANINGLISTAVTYTDGNGFAIPSALAAQYSPRNVRVPVVITVSQSVAQMFINGKLAAKLAGFHLPYSAGSWELLHTNYRSALFDYTGYPKPETMSQQLVHWDTLQFDGPAGTYNPLVRTYVQPGCRGAMNQGVNGDLNQFEGCPPFLSPDNPKPTINWTISDDATQARSGRLLYNGGGVSGLSVAINGYAPIALPTVRDPSATTALNTYALKPTELAQLRTGANTLSFQGTASTIYGLSGLELEVIYNLPRGLTNPPQDYGATLRLTEDNFRFDYLPNSTSPTWRQTVQNQTAYIYNGGGATTNPYSVKVLNGPIPWLAVSTPGQSLSGTLAPPTRGGSLLELKLTVDFAQFNPTADPSLGQPAVLEVDGGEMPEYLTVLAVKGGAETPNVIPAGQYLPLFMNTFNLCGGGGTIGVPGYEAACSSASPTPVLVPTNTPTLTLSSTPTATLTPAPTATGRPTDTPVTRPSNTPVTPTPGRGIFARATVHRAVNDASATRISIALPAVQQGDLEVAELSLGSDGGGTPAGATPPPGWTLIGQAADAGNGVLAWAWYHVVGDGEPATSTWTWQGQSNALVSVTTFAGVDTTSIYDPSAQPGVSTSFAFGGQGTWPGLTTSRPGTLWVVAGATSQLNSVSPRFTVAVNSQTVGGNNAEATVAYRTVSKAGSTGGAKVAYRTGGGGAPQAIIVFGLAAAP